MNSSHILLIHMRNRNFKQNAIFAAVKVNSLVHYHLFKGKISIKLMLGFNTIMILYIVCQF